MAARRLSDSEKQELVGRYKAGESTAALAETFGCSPNRGPNGLRARSQKPGTPAGLLFSPTKEVMARATAAETSDRIDALQGLILEGEPNTA